MFLPFYSAAEGNRPSMGDGMAWHAAPVEPLPTPPGRSALASGPIRTRSVEPAPLCRSFAGDVRAAL
jgi:hypothetical protein